MLASGKMSAERVSRVPFAAVIDTNNFQHIEGSSQVLAQACSLVVSSSKAAALANIPLDHPVQAYSSCQLQLQGLVKWWAARKSFDIEVLGEGRLGDQCRCDCHLEEV